MKAVILAAGKGTRMLPFTETKQKVLLPIAGKPFLYYLLENLRQAGITDFCIVANHRIKDIKQFLEDYGYGGKVVFQKECLGTANAAYCGKEFVGSDEFILVHGDNLYSVQDIKEIALNNGKTYVKGQKVNHPQYYGVLFTENGKLKKIVEKPKEFIGDIVNTGMYKLTSKIFDYIEKTPKSAVGEYYFTDTISIFAEKNEVSVSEIKDYWIDFGVPWHFFYINSKVLDEMDSFNEGKVSKKATVYGKVILDEGAQIKDHSYVEGPCYIGKNTVIGPGARIRPYTSIGNNCKIGLGTEIKNSIIMDDTKIPHKSTVGDSVIGFNCNFGAGTNVANLRFDEKTVKVMINGKLTDSERRKLGCFMGDNVKTGINAMIMPGVKIAANSTIMPGQIVNRDID